MCSLAARQLTCSSKSNDELFVSPAQKAIARQLTQGYRRFSSYDDKFYKKATDALEAAIDVGCLQNLRPGQVEPPARLSTSSNTTVPAEVEDIIARLIAACACAEYESIAGTENWSRHLDEFGRVLNILSGGNFLKNSLSSQQVLNTENQRTVQAAFWW